MNIVGYFLALTNLQAIGGRSPNLNDVSVKIADLATLANYLKYYPGFSVHDFKEDQINHVGDVGMFLSNNLWRFCLNGEGNAKDEGVVITFTYNIRGDDEQGPNFAGHSFLFSKEGLSYDTIRQLLQQLHIHYSNRNKFIIIKDTKEEA